MIPNRIFWAITNATAAITILGFPWMHLWPLLVILALLAVDLVLVLVKP